MDWGRSHLKCGILTGNEMHKLCQRYTNLFVFLRVYRILPILGPSGQKLSDPKSEYVLLEYVNKLRGGL